MMQQAADQLSRLRAKTSRGANIPGLRRSAKLSTLLALHHFASEFPLFAVALQHLGIDAIACRAKQTGALMSILSLLETLPRGEREELLHHVK
jgi:hypothetical protein